MYMFAGKTTVWASPDSETSPPSPTDTTEQEYEHMQDIIAMKRIESTDVSLCIPRHDWTSGTHYNMYEHDKTDLFTDSTPFYVVTDNYDVYKCISNGGSTGGSGDGGNDNSSTSTVKPTGTSTNITATGDGYRWKYMYTISAGDAVKFLTNDYMPVEYLTSDDGSAQWDVQQAAKNSGSPSGVQRLEHIEVTAGGSGYTGGTTTVSISGGGGSGATATVEVSGGAVVSVDLTNEGSGYTSEPTVTISDSSSPSGTGATAKAILSPIGGHGYNPAEELGGYFSMVTSRFEYDESGYFPVSGSDADFRKVGILADPVDDSTDEIAKETRYIGPDHSSYSASPATSLNKVKENTGSLLYIENRQAVTRDSDQVESIAAVIEF